MHAVFLMNNKIDSVKTTKWINNSLKLPIIKKLPGSVCSFKLLYDKSKTSNTGKAPNPLGNVFNLLMDTFRILNFGIEDSDTGSSSIWLLAKFKISKLMRLAIPGGRIDILLWLSVIRVTFSMLTEIDVDERSLSMCMQQDIHKSFPIAIIKSDKCEKINFSLIIRCQIYKIKPSKWQSSKAEGNVRQVEENSWRAWVKS